MFFLIYSFFCSVYSSITNENGVVVVDIIITKTSTVYCSFAGTSDYEACISNQINITFIGKIGLRFGGDRSNFNFYVKNIKIEVL